MLKETWNKWKMVSQKIGNAQISFVFSLLYFILIVPVGLVAKFFRDYLDAKKNPKWNSVDDDSSTLIKLREQY